MMDNKSIAVLGSTGSVGRQTLNVASRLGLTVASLALNKNITLAEQQARIFKPAFVGVYDESSAKDLAIKLADTDIKVGSGSQAVSDAVCGAGTVVTALSGAVGLLPTLAAIDAGSRIALANKETLVCAGSLVMKRAALSGSPILPVDSEHSAIFQCLTGGKRAELRKILLTASGGPFRGRTRLETAGVTPAEALKHPTWNMGAKISIDSATMMNKGLEFIEAMHLFNVSPGEIEVLIHPQSVVHSAVEFVDGSVIAQLGTPDMSLPIQYALTYPERLDSSAQPLDLTTYRDLSFFAPDYVNFPCLKLAIDCAALGGTAPAVMNAANEVAVSLFLDYTIAYNDIYDLTVSAVENVEYIAAPTLDDILASDALARDYVLNLARHTH